MANSGFPDEGEFEILSGWMKRFTERMRSTLMGEFYFAGGKRLKDPENQQAAEYLESLAASGEKIINSHER